MKLFVATHNQHKIREISQILPDFEILADDPEGVEEDAPDFTGNALIKVRAIAAKHRGDWCMADDSGLEVEALGGAPGVRSARYAGEPSNTPNNNALLLKNLTGHANRRANFTCAIALVDPSGIEHTAVGKCFGHIAETLSGAAGFGYDPLFIPDGYDKSFAELTPDEKNAISHRGRALEKARKVIGGSRILAWLRFFRIVNLPTVPGDVMVGAAAVFYMLDAGSFNPVLFAALASCCTYLYGLADNDIVGAKTDVNRPIPNGAISLVAARVARGLCWGGTLVFGAVGNLPPVWWVMMLGLFGAITVYNRTKNAWLMGACRGINLLTGAAAVFACSSVEWWRSWIPPIILATVWTLYIGGVTRYSEGEETDPHKRRTVGFLIGALVYLQLLVLVLFALMAPRVSHFRPLLLTGAVMLVLLRLGRGLFSKVSAS